MAESSGIDPTQKEARPKRFLGVRPTEHSNPFLAGYDYTHKYPEDARYHELDDDARVWAVYNDEARIYDTEIVAEAGESLDVILIFAGLFSSVLATFVAQSSQALGPDQAAISARILRELADIQRAQSDGTAISAISRAEIQTSSSSADIWVNGLWFTSLVVSLSTALIAVLAKQWLRQYLSIISGSQKDRALIHYFRRTSFDKWRVRGIIGFLPTLLHLALFLFLAGLVVQLYSLSRAIALIVLAVTAALSAAYIFALLAPVCDPTCPYQTTLTDALLYPWTFALSSVTIQRILGWPFPGPVEEFTPPWSTDDRPELLKAAAAQPVRNREYHCSTKEVRSQKFCFRPLLWMDRTTSNPSARAVILDAVGAIYEPDTKAAVAKALRRDLELAFTEKGDMMERLLRALDPTERRGCEAVMNFFPIQPINIGDAQLALTTLSVGKYNILLSDTTGLVHAFTYDLDSILPQLIESFPLEELPLLPAHIWARFPINIPGPKDDCTPKFMELVASYALNDDSDYPSLGRMRSNEFWEGGARNMTLWHYLCPLLATAGWFSVLNVEEHVPATFSGSVLIHLDFSPDYSRSRSIQWNLIYPDESKNVEEEMYRFMLGDFKIDHTYSSPNSGVEHDRLIGRTKAKLRAWWKRQFGSRNNDDVKLGITSGGSEGVELQNIA